MGGFNPLTGAAGYALGGGPTGSAAIPAGLAGGAAGGKGSGGPSSPDFSAAARTATNTPFAGDSYSKNADGSYTHNVGLNGPLAGANQNLQDQFAKGWGTPLDNGADARQHAEDAIYQRETSRLDPMWNNREQSNRTQLEQQGIDPNSAAGKTSMDTLGRSRNDAYSSALHDAIMGGGQEATRQQGMDLQSRLAPLMGMQGLQGLTQLPGNQLLPAAIAQYQGGLQKYGIDQQGKNSTMGGLTGLGGSLGAAAIAA